MVCSWTLFSPPSCFQPGTFAGGSFPRFATYVVSRRQTLQYFLDLVPRYIEVCYQAAGSDQSKSLLYNLHSHIVAFRCFVPTESILRLDFTAIHSCKCSKPPYLLEIFDTPRNGVVEILKYIMWLRALFKNRSWNNTLKCWISFRRRGMIRKFF
jgi:hypothetical protein